MKSFKEVFTSDVLDLIREADTKKAFLPSASEPEFSVERFLSQENFPGYRLFGVVDELGQMTSFISVKPKDGETLVIGPMYVAEAFRGQGIGKWQVVQLIEWAKLNNIRELSTKTWGANKGSRRIFEELGFKLIEEKPGARVNGDSTVKYHKEVR